MRKVLVITTGLLFGWLNGVLAADPVTPAPAAERTELPAATPGVVPRPVAEAPKPAEKLKPMEKPRPTVETPKTMEPAVPTATTESPVVSSTEVGGYSLGCLALAFAMLIAGFAAGFVARHLVSRRKLGGMTVRIGTWRGIP
jgi:hypothetical protein